MLHLLLAGGESQTLKRLCSELAQKGFVCSTVSPAGQNLEDVSLRSVDVVLFEVDGPLSAAGVQEFKRRFKAGGKPFIALVARGALANIDEQLDADDFIGSPYEAAELVLRIKRLLARRGSVESGNLVRCDGLVIDLDKCEVAVDGRVIDLTFKEYELLRFMASNRGRVYSRDTLLNRVWGHDYFGGDRTVDVHIRRLRSKIEGPRHSFIETVRNIGYRFRKEL